MTASLRNPGGYASWTGPQGIVRECDTFTCAHCNGIVFVGVTIIGAQKAPELGGHCMKCDKPICALCADHGECRPFERWLEKMESAITARLLDDRQYERIVQADAQDRARKCG